MTRTDAPAGTLLLASFLLALPAEAQLVVVSQARSVESAVETTDETYTSCIPSARSRWRSPASSRRARTRWRPWRRERPRAARPIRLLRRAALGELRARAGARARGPRPARLGAAAPRPRAGRERAPGASRATPLTPHRPASGRRRLRLLRPVRPGENQA